jgi:pimeloyl-ACP methyl ester carboxylesterase
MDTEVATRATLNDAISSVTLQGHDGLALVADVYGGSAQPRLIWTHGFGQNRLSWRAAAARMAALGFNGWAFDARGHGDSAWAAQGAYQIDDFVDDLRSIAAQQSNKPILIGASMGGLLGLMVEADTLGGAFSALVLVDVTPRFESSGVQRILNFMNAYPEGFADLEQANAAVKQYLPHRDNTDPQRLQAHLRRMPNGRWRWHWDPALLAMFADDPQAFRPRLEQAATRVRCPVLLLAGGKSDVVSQQSIADFQRLVPHAKARVIDSATHMVVGDANDRFGEEIETFLAQFSGVASPSYSR